MYRFSLLSTKEFYYSMIKVDRNLMRVGNKVSFNSRLETRGIDF